MSVDCTWGEYGDWSQCTESCGGGTQNRLRSHETQAMNGGADCEGTNVEERICNAHKCAGK